MAGGGWGWGGGRGASRRTTRDKREGERHKPRAVVALKGETSCFLLLYASGDVGSRA